MVYSWVEVLMTSFLFIPEEISVLKLRLQDCHHPRGGDSGQGIERALRCAGIHQRLGVCRGEARCNDS